MKNKNQDTLSLLLGPVLLCVVVPLGYLLWAVFLRGVEIYLTILIFAWPVYAACKFIKSQMQEED